MDYAQIIKRLVDIYSKQQYDELVDELLDINEPILKYPFRALLSLVDNKIDEAKEIIYEFDLTDYYKEEYEDVLKFISNVAYRLQCVSRVKEISDYFYAKTKDVAYTFIYLDLKVSMSNSYKECENEVEKIVEQAQEYSKFSYRTQDYIFNYLYLKEEFEKIFELSLETDEKFQIDTGKYIKHTELAFEKGQYSFIVDYFEKINPFIEHEDYDKYEFLGYYIKSKDALFIEVSVDELNELAKYLRFTIDNYKIFSKYIGKYKIDEDVVELVNILEKKKIKVKHRDNKLFKLLIDYDFKAGVKFCLENKLYADVITQFSLCLISYDNNIKEGLYDYLSELFTSKHSCSYFYLFALERTIDSKRFEDFEGLLKRIKLEDHIERFSARLNYHANKVDKVYYLYYFGQGLLNVSDNPIVEQYAKVFLLCWYYSRNDKEKFIPLYEEIKDKVSFDYSLLMDAGKNNHQNKELFIHILDKKDKNLSVHYANCISSYLYSKNGVNADLDLVGKIIKVLEELMAKYEDEIELSSNCLQVEKGIYKYYLGELKESEEIISNAAYTSSAYCNCGVVALLTLNDHKYGDDAYEINKKIVLNSVNGLQLVGEDKYEKATFNNNASMYNYFAYYALMEEEGFDAEMALTHIYNQKMEDVQSCFFAIKLGLKLGIENIVDEFKNKIQLYKDAKDIVDYDLKYTEILEDNDCPLYKPETFHKALFSFKM